ncbi:hypothetical protein KKE19_03585 [Patescibacteria group bacterium]|nr:hypothetical protein [Patescibacteria group bacterium]MBU4274868.1 hypothetical protein [Patescibacteria group bacterium]MBU4367963.1 hypothetical protein [Patescibacteria group bacterium]MBU4462144.1 hypothetical protein [Patescibacteria group bacterium]MCG2699806.1 hypothetical protein [Candidatus Parcubacteria bacterium]
MAICNSFLKESDDELVAAAQRGEFSGIKSCSPEIQAQIERSMPAVEAAIKESTERVLFFESDPEGREVLLKSGHFGEFSPEEINAIEKDRTQQESLSFRTLHGEFEIRQDPGSNLPIEEVKRIYREETPHCVVENLQGVGHIDKVKQVQGKDGKPETILGEHHSFVPEKDGTPVPHLRSEIYTYKHPENTLKSRRETLEVLQRGNPEEIRQALMQKEKETHFHEIGEEIYERHFTLEEIQECDKIHQEAVKGGWLRAICDHSRPTAPEYVCDAYAMFKTNPQRLKSIDGKMFELLKSKTISLEVKDTFASLEGQEDQGE